MKNTTLPPDPEKMNNDRAEWAAAALRHFQCTTGADYDDALSDLLGDLMHWCDRNELNFDAELSRARMHYEAETSISIEILVDALSIIAAGNTDLERMVQIAIDALESEPTGRAKTDPTDEISFE